MAKKAASSKVTIMQVAERTGVSLGTISPVMNNDTYIAPDTRERVSAVMRELGCVANLVKGIGDGLLLVLVRNPADYIGIRPNANFPFLSIDQQGAGRLCLNAGFAYRVLRRTGRG